MLISEFESGRYDIRNANCDGGKRKMNITEKHCKELLLKLNNIRSFIITNSSDEEREKLQKYLDEIEDEIANKKYGLIFEEHCERIDEILKTHIPVFTEKKNLYLNNGGDTNLLLEGDNLPVLKNLEKSVCEKIDLIIIDPPYNGGKNRFRYTDDFINNKDNYTHSRWLSFMEKRLLIARRLLRRDGYIFINIDENELAHLKVLCDSIFGEENFVGIYLWEKTSTPPAISKKIRKKFEYILCYAKELDALHQFSQGLIEGGDAPLLNNGNKVKTLIFPKGSVKFSIPDGVYDRSSYQKVSLVEPVTVRDGCNENELVIQGAFKWLQKTLDKELGQGTEFIVRSKRFSIRYHRKGVKKIKTPQDLLNGDLQIGTNETAARELKALGLPKFSYPKPVSLYSFLIKMVNANKNMTVLDFFAGSGTTGEAVLQVNRELGVKHKFILCTDNQDNICINTTYERIKRVISNENYEASLKYYKVEFVKVKKKRRVGKKLQENKIIINKHIKRRNG